jgi:hypothetical protein
MTSLVQTGIGRPLDPRLVSNRIAVAGGLLGTVLALVLQWINGESINIIAAGAMGVGVFLAWAIARELDPDHPSSATFAVAIAAGAIAFGPSASGAVAVAMLGARVMVGTVGTHLRPADIVVLSAAAAYAGTRPEGWGAAALLIAGVFVARPRRSGVIAATLAIATLAGAALAGTTSAPGTPTSLTVALIALTVVATAISYPARRVASHTDNGRSPISATRVTMARVGIASAIVVGGVLGADGAQTLAPAIAALVGVALIQLASLQTASARDHESKLPTHSQSLSSSP